MENFLTGKRGFGVEKQAVGFSQLEICIIVPAGGEVSKEASNSLSNIPAYFLIVALPRPHEHLHASKHHSIVQYRIHAIRRGAEYPLLIPLG